MVTVSKTSVCGGTILSEKGWKSKYKAYAEV